jgi:hypothetical protein
MPKQLNIIDDLLRQADPFAVAASPDLVPAMTSGGNRNSLSGNADLRPMVYRAGSLDALDLPSRMGNTLFYRDGRVEVIAS